LNIYYEAKRIYNNRTGLGNYSRWLVSNYRNCYPEDKLILLRPKGNGKKSEVPFSDANYQIQSYSNFLGYQRSFNLYKLVAEHSVFHGLSNELPILNTSKSILKIVSIHDVIFKVRPNDYAMVDRMIYDFKIKKAVKNAHHIVAISQKTKQDLMVYYGCDPVHISVIYQNCDLLFYERCTIEFRSAIQLKYGLPDDYWISVGSFNARKNQLNLVLAMNQIPEHQRTPILFVGEGNTKNKIIKYIQEYKLEKWFQFAKVESNLELAALYQGALGLIYPSLYEGFGIPAIEALASGIPVIGHKGSAVEEAGGLAGLFIDMVDAEELAYTLIQLPSDSNRLVQLKTNAKIQLAKFENKHLMGLQHDVYKKLNS